MRKFEAPVATFSVPLVSSEVQPNDTISISVQNTDSWDIDDWNELPCTGITLDGTNMSATHNHIINVNFGINALGDSNRRFEPRGILVFRKIVSIPRWCPYKIGKLFEGVNR